ncbi:BZ3500_MvSof-1268-A1-R1_Chr4-1g06707 [Microbotryum saponariae]|uniref:BZ3500_MvSof-1268-A1-R1_Chr4-1g06707 protein n=1 Tax=Microbotryum saponariae TaxID=289078 RepID=A0A2X0NFF9_9BASI|nr:BZ3500_MvSof-1268-A1-R1_Chr4-1g06707 [Microbotryum saponariae]SDA06372.1 BZ3501_MvSof-1269-A2-R1_Chr4-1g06417 [Microbotryum saponariae]
MMRSSPPLLNSSFDHPDGRIDSPASPPSPSSYASPTATLSRIGSGRARGPPARSQTYDDHYYLGPGAPSAQSRGYGPASPLSLIATGSESPTTSIHSNRTFDAGTIGGGWPSQSRRNVESGAYLEPSPGGTSGGAPAPSSSSSSSSSLGLLTDPLPLGSYTQHQQSLWGQAQIHPSHYASSLHSPRDYAHLPPPRSIGLYNQQNHSSPALAVNSRLSAGSEPAAPSLDDINLGLESMSFEQREQRHSAGGNGLTYRMDPGRSHTPGQDGAMEIRGRQGTASVYSVDSMYSIGSGQAGPAGPALSHNRRTSNNSMRQSFGAVGAEHLRGSQASSAPLEDELGALPFDDHYREVPQHIQHPPQGSPHPSSQYSDYHAASGPPPASPYADGSVYGPMPQLQHQTSYASSAYGSEASYQPGAPHFSPQPPHGSWGYDQAGQVAAQNPYYAAQFGGAYPQQNDPSVWGQHLSLNRQPSTMSSASMMMYGNPGGAPSGRPGSSLSVPSAQPRMARKGTGSSTGSGASNNSGPPITKASVDEYRQRIKADPDPEAQFNFAKYLIEAAKKINSSAHGDEKSAKKYRDALLAESLKLIKRLATQGSGVGKPAYADAQFFLANCLGNGSLGLQVDHEKAYNLYVQASKQNHSSATYRTAVCNEVGAGTRRDHARAVLFYRKASALGDTAGMYKLGMILLNGLLGQQRNPKEAVNWLKRAASQADEDNPHALHELGLLYEKPPPPVQPTGPNGGPPTAVIPHDPAQARELFTQAGQLGYPPSQFKLGSCYEYGSLTCPVDPRRSIAWYTRAAERGDAESELALSGWYLTGSEGVLKQSDSEAYLWARRAANKGLPKAEYAVGFYSEVGIGVKQDLEEAKRWYMRSAAQGNKRAMQRLTELKKLGATRAGVKGGKGQQARPTRQEAATECIVM